MENENRNPEVNPDVKTIISQNIIKYRKQLGMTQLELAEKLNYSDKTLSKWERGESIPDIVTLKQLADIFNVSVDVLIGDENAKIGFTLPQKERKKLSKRNITSISLLSIGIVWLLATVVFVTLNVIDYDFSNSVIKPWICFIYAIPVSMIILLVFSCIWGNKFYQFVTTSALLWTLAVSLHLSLRMFEGIALIYIIPIPLQVMAFIFFIILKKRKKVESK